MSEAAGGTLKVVTVAAEMVPFSKTGGLADVAGALPKALVRLGHEVHAITPMHRTVREQGLSPAHGGQLEVRLGAHTVPCTFATLTAEPGIAVHFVEHEEYFDRKGLYGTSSGDYPDNANRFAFFCLASLEILKALELEPDVLHSHDWHTGLLPLYLKRQYRDHDRFAKTASVFTVHNLAYQGVFPLSVGESLGFGPDVARQEDLEFWGNISFMKGGLVHADVVNTVSRTYSREIQTEELGCGLEGVLRSRSQDLYGIVNGIDYDEWNPQTDSRIPSRYGPGDFDRKLVNKQALQEEQGLEQSADIPLIGIVTRLADQKGLDLIAKVVRRIVGSGAQFVVLGTGDAKHHRTFGRLRTAYAGNVGINIRFDAGLARRIYAGSDMFLMPSRFEPCGLGQLIGFRYGTIPIVRRTGGLADTVADLDPATGEGSGFVFEEYTPEALWNAISRGLCLYRNQSAWRQLVARVMSYHFSWEQAAREYVGLYRTAREKVAQE